jgi:glutathionyl-hydroquinone reductase
VTLLRFDAAYCSLFMCNMRRLADYPNLTAYLKRVLDIPGIRDTINIDHIKKGYYSVKSLNPNGIVPNGLDLSSLGL